MVERGEWVASQPFAGHASFRIWAAYSYSPNATWGHIAKEFLAAKRDGPQSLQTFVNTVLGETWQQRGEAPDWLRLYQLREHYERGTVPAGVLVLTAGVDVQRDRLVWEVVGWGADRQSWSIDSGVIPGRTETSEPWAKLDELLDHQWPAADGTIRQIQLLAVDSGDQTQIVYNWARRYPMSRVIACKGVGTAKTLIDKPSTVDVTVRGKRLARGYRVWPVGGSIAKSELYGWLRLEPPTTESGEPFPPGYCHFPEYGEGFFKELTAEHLVPVVKRTGFTIHEWQILPGRENHFLDCRVYARAAAALVGLDRHAAARIGQRAPAAAPAPPAPTAAQEVPKTNESASPARRKGWLAGGRGGWLRR